MTATPSTIPTAELLDLPIGELADHPANLRFDLGDVSELAASIQENGLVEPIVVARLGDGSGYRIIAGHRRTVACRQLGWQTVPAIHRPDLVSDDVTTPEHLATMLAENTQREGLSRDEISAGLAQLAAFPGLSPAKVAKRTGHTVEQVKHAVASAKLPEDVRPLVVADSLTLDQAAELVEFEDDPKTYARLLKKLSAGGWGAATAIAEERRRRETNAEKKAVVTELRERGVRVVGAPNQWDFPQRSRMQPISNLRNSKGKKLTPSAHSRCAGHAAFLRIEQYQSAGKRVSVHLVCTDPEDHGHELAQAYSGRDSGPTLTEAEQATQAEAAEQTRIEWAAATDARWGWLVALFRAKQLPEAVARVALGAECPHNPARVNHLLTGAHSNEDEDHQAIEAAYEALAAKEPVARLHRHTVAYYVAAMESHAYRLDPIDARSWAGRLVADWLRILASIGYELSPTEQAVTETWPAQTADSENED
jgi:ParB family transcriptional regulator, chromosome partitioning protein